MKKRSWIAVDRFALADVRREYELTATEVYLLEQVAKLAGPRKGEKAWSGALWELAEFTGLGRTTVRRVLTKLIDRGLLSEPTPFVGGHSGKLAVVCYDVLVVPKAEWRAPPTPRSRFAHAEYDAGDQPEHPLSYGSEGSGKVGTRAGHSLEGSATIKGADAVRRLRRTFPGAEDVG